MMQVKVFEESKRKQWIIIVSLWDKIKDKGTPHFLFEHGHLLIRYDEKCDKVIKKELKDFKTEYDSEWIEWSKEVTDNPEFKEIFYLISSIAIRNKPVKGFRAKHAWERITHCAYNMLSRLMLDSDGDEIQESRLYQSMAWLTAFSEGALIGKYYPEQVKDL